MPVRIANPTATPTPTPTPAPTPTGPWLPWLPWLSEPLLEVGVGWVVDVAARVVLVAGVLGEDGLVPELVVPDSGGV